MIGRLAVVVEKISTEEVQGKPRCGQVRLAEANKMNVQRWDSLGQRSTW